ncbi:DUF5107 domain-containing protein [Streptomyces sp. NPDC097619]|uniref:DUF5107 domain-containing protein n=1 Tax=Streptomyces sp. NPDC097619 TaxID=3157228 RepID=UPI00331B30D6
MSASATTVRRAVLTLPAAPLGPENPLPALRPPTGPQDLDARTRSELPRDMARQVGYGRLRGLLPVRLLDGYQRCRTDTAFDAVVIENAHLRATVLPGLGGRVVSLVAKEPAPAPAPDGAPEPPPVERELLYRNPVFQPAAFGLAGAWFSGGIEWNIGATGHTVLACRPLHAALVTGPDGGPVLRLWEWERLRDLPFQVDLWLPADSRHLYAGIRVRNPHERPAPLSWWSNTAVPETPGTRVLAPAEEAWHHGYERTLRRIPVPHWEGADRSYPLHGEHPADYFYDLPDEARPWIASLGPDGRGLVQTSTDLLRGRKLFLWGAGTGGRRWQEWLTEPGTPGYAEIQAGLTRTQLEHLRLPPGAACAWLEAYGPLAADPALVHGADWSAARAEAAARLAEDLPRARVEEAYAAWLDCADAEPGERLATGSGWGALEVLRAGHELPGTPFGKDDLDEAQAPWAELLRTGAFPAPRRAAPPGPTLVAPHWRDMLETAPADPLTEYHLGVAQWHAGDLAQAVRSWERGLTLAPSRWPLLRCLAVADELAGHTDRAADRFAEAFEDLCLESRGGPDWTAAEAALGREALTALLAARRPAEARTVWERLRPALRERGRFRLLAARLLVAEGHVAAARRIFEEGFEVADLREGEDSLTEAWSALSPAPLPALYDFRMHP